MHKSNEDQRNYLTLWFYSIHFIHVDLMWHNISNFYLTFWIHQTFVKGHISIEKIRKTKILLIEKWKKLFWDHVWQIHLYLSGDICDALLFIYCTSPYTSKYKLKMVLMYPTLLKPSRRYMSHKMWFCIFFFLFIVFWGSFLPKCDYDIPKSIFTKFQSCLIIFRAVMKKNWFFWFLKCQHYVRTFWLCP